MKKETRLRGIERKALENEHGHLKYAGLVTDGKRFNIQLTYGSSIGSINLQPFVFPQMVSEKEAREMYDELQ